MVTGGGGGCCVVGGGGGGGVGGGAEHGNKTSQLTLLATTLIDIHFINTVQPPRRDPSFP